uniref:Pept_C1 domain-containing protein n=1 Tax=Macrostomum lignano TaxID=282301 RepID=A0A1I8FZF2_9PLAT
MAWQQRNLLLALIIVFLCHSGVTASRHRRLFGIDNEHLTEENSRQFHAGICNASLPLNDHLYQLIGWCTKLGLGRRCLSHGVAACLFKKYIDLGAKIDAADGLASGLSKRQQIFWARLLGKEPSGGIKGAARYGITKFMHLSPTEFRERYLSSLIVNASATKVNNEGTEPKIDGLRKKRSDFVSPDVLSFEARPNRIDWRDSKDVTKVKNQGACGACWAFAVTEVAESEFAAGAYGPLTDLSVQQVTDCTSGSAGCGGGDICHTASYYSGGGERIVQDSLYPYVGKNEPCRQVTGGYQVGTTNVLCRNWNHAVQIVGYDLTSDTVPFYLVRNSWGSDWGMSGFLQIAQGLNMCGIAKQVVTFGVSTD